MEGMQSGSENEVWFEIDERHIERPRPEVEGPNPIPTNGDIETNTEPYAAGWPTNRKNAWSAKLAAENLAKRREARQSSLAE
ncbi:MAG TPA: hypothetical protein VGA08_02645 [Candidatus Saccharimonadales bacterium]